MLQDEVRIIEVGPRDGLQNIPRFIPTGAKIRLIERLADAGLRFIEATSFVNPEMIPQMRDSREVADALPLDRGVTFSALVPNMRGLEAALAAGLPQVGVLTAATETYTRLNTNTTIAGSLDRIADIITAARPAGVSVRGYVSCAVSCPYEGAVDPHRPAELAATLAELGCDEVILGDTVGDGTPPKVAHLLEATLQSVPPVRLGVHFHDTYGQALSNTVEALRHGVRMIDSSVAGLGGSPSAPGAGGNLPTEDLLFLLEGMGVRTGIDLGEVARIGLDFCARWGIPHASTAGRAIGERTEVPP